MKASIDFINKSGRDIFANYEKDGKQIIIKITTYKGEPIIRVVAATINDKLEELDEAFWDFKDFAKYYEIDYSLEGWVASYEIDCSKSQFKLSDVIELINHTDTNGDSCTNNDESYSVEVKTTHVDRDTYTTVVPPLNISDDTLKKQAEYTTTEMFKSFERLQQFKKRRDTDSDKKETTVESEQYSLEDFNKDVQGVDADTLVKLLHIKQALLLISPPGTGKTTTAIALAKYIEKETNSDRVKIVSFNQFTSYSDIIGGYQKDENGDWVITKGSLFEMADRASADTENTYIYISDEINRANTEAVYGEAITAMSQRGKAVTTNFGLKLTIPKNLWIIGTMNSTDSSITELDTALVDRFMVYRMEDVDLETSKINKTTNKNLLNCIEKVRDAVIKINKYLEEDIYRKKDNKIGNRALYGDYTTVDELILVVKYDIQPKVESKKVNLNEQTCKEIDNIFKELYKHLEDAKQWEDSIR